MSSEIMVRWGTLSIVCYLDYLLLKFVLQSITHFITIIHSSSSQIDIIYNDFLAVVLQRRMTSQNRNPRKMKIQKYFTLI